MIYDVAIIGAGPGGSTTAYFLSRAGAKVLLIDSKINIGKPVQCGEFVPLQLRLQFPKFFSEELVVQRVRNMVHFTPWGEISVTPSEGFLLNRDKFDERLVKLAIKEGTEARFGIRFVSFEGKNLILKDRRSGNIHTVRSDIIVGADGARSTVAKLTGEYTKTFLPAAQITLPLKEKLEDLLIFFREYIPGGYGWIFPKGNVANVGVGIDPRHGLKISQVLKKFKEEVIAEGFVEDSILKRTGGFIPAEGMKKPLRGNVLLVGDAGGFCHPITGAGIANAVQTGVMASSAILENSLQSYEEECREIFGEFLGRAVLKRVKYMGHWENLKFTVPRTWITFKEYREEV